MASHVTVVTFTIAVVASLAWGPSTVHCDHLFAKTAKENEHLALEAIYTSTLGAGWYRSNGWSDPDDNDYCNWQGVTCDPYGYVQELRLSNNGLSGTLPENIGDLTRLRFWSMQTNAIGGSIPASVGQMTRMAVVWLHGNRLSGSVPEEFGNVTPLQELYLTDNLLSGTIPAELSSLPNLRTIYLEHNRLEGVIPADIGDLAKLKILHASANSLTGPVPASLANAANLKSLRLDHNQLTGDLSDAALRSRLASTFTVHLEDNFLSLDSEDELELCGPPDATHSGKRDCAALPQNVPHSEL